MSNIIIRNVSKSFGDKSVLNDFSCTFPEEKISVIMGESGCGKTTLVNIIMGLLKADAGEISGIPSRISAVFQEDCLSEDFSAVSNVRAITGRKVSKANIAAHLAALGLTEKDITIPVRDLSGGMKRRVAISRAILADSELVIMDEPFKGLDNDTRKSVIDFVLSETQGRTLIVITHSPEEIQLLSAEHIIRL